MFMVCYNADVEACIADIKKDLPNIRKECKEFDEFLVFETTLYQIKILNFALN